MENTVPHLHIETQIYDPLFRDRITVIVENFMIREYNESMEKSVFVELVNSDFPGN